MVLVTELRGWADVPAFVGWALASAGLGRALLGSFAAKELRSRLLRRDAARANGLARVEQLRFELQTRRRRPAGASSPDPLTDSPPLTRAELEANRAEYEQLARASIWIRVALWLLECRWCQVFWGAALLLAAPTCILTACVATACAFAELMTLATRACSGQAEPAAHGGAAGGAPCGGQRSK